jgi:hypothetical protein
MAIGDNRLTLRMRSLFLVLMRTFETLVSRYLRGACPGTDLASHGPAALFSIVAVADDGRPRRRTARHARQTLEAITRPGQLW